MILHFLFIPTSNTLTEPLPIYFFKPLPPYPSARLDVSFRMHITILHFYENSFSFFLELSSRKRVRVPCWLGNAEGHTPPPELPDADVFDRSALIMC